MEMIRRIAGFLGAAAVLLFFPMQCYGSSASAPVKSVRFRSAVITRIDAGAGSVCVLRGGAELAVYEGMRLAKGDTVATSGNAAVYLGIDQDRVLRLAGESSAVMEEAFPGDRVRLRLLAGSMFLQEAGTLPGEDAGWITNGNGAVRSAVETPAMF